MWEVLHIFFDEKLSHGIKKFSQKNLKRWRKYGAGAGLFKGRRGFSLFLFTFFN